MKMDRKQETSSESMHDSIECSTLQQSYLESSTAGSFEQIISRKLANKTIEHNSEQIPQLKSEFSSSLGDAISTTNCATGKWQLSQNIGNSETMRWQDCCEDPIKVSQRMEKYKADRRQRYYDHAKNKTTTSRIMQKFSSLIFCYLIQYNYGLFIT